MLNVVLIAHILFFLVTIGIVAFRVFTVGEAEELQPWPHCRHVKCLQTHKVHELL